MPPAQKAHGPGVFIPPPLLFVVGFLLGWLLDRQVARLRLVPDVDEPVVVAIGLGVVLLGVILAAWGMITFARARTAIVPIRPASQLVQSGPYTFSRNPMYTGLTIAYVGAATVMNTVWPLLVLPFVLVSLYRLVVVREERYLTEVFGEEYRAYTQRVRRWL